MIRKSRQARTITARDANLKTSLKKLSRKRPAIIFPFKAEAVEEAKSDCTATST